MSVSEGVGEDKALLVFSEISRDTSVDMHSYSHWGLKKTVFFKSPFGDLSASAMRTMIPICTR